MGWVIFVMFGVFVVVCFVFVGLGFLFNVVLILFVVGVLFVM